MPLEHLPKKPNIVLIITDQEREVMHWPEGWAEAKDYALRRAAVAQATLHGIVTSARVTRQR